MPAVGGISRVPNAAASAPSGHWGAYGRSGNGMRAETAVGPFLLHPLHLTRRWSRQDKPETLGLREIS
jgi:hypothetical protein